MNDKVSRVIVRRLSLLLAATGMLVRTQKSLRKALRESAWEHYVDCISKELRRNNLLDNFEQEQQKRKEAGRPLSVKPKLAFPTRHTHIGMEAFHDPKQTAAKHQAHFRTHWMADRKLSK